MPIFTFNISDDDTIPIFFAIGGVIVVSMLIVFIYLYNVNIHSTKLALMTQGYTSSDIKCIMSIDSDACVVAELNRTIASQQKLIVELQEK